MNNYPCRIETNYLDSFNNEAVISIDYVFGIEFKEEHVSILPAKRMFLKRNKLNVLDVHIVFDHHTQEGEQLTFFYDK